MLRRIFADRIDHTHVWPDSSRGGNSVAGPRQEAVSCATPAACLRYGPRTAVQTMVSIDGIRTIGDQTQAVQPDKFCGISAKAALHIRRDRNRQGGSKSLL